MNPSNCRLCGRELLPRPVLRLDGIPKAAQYFPPKEEFASDKGITLDIYQCSACALVQLTTPPVTYFREVITAASLSGKARMSRLSQMEELAETYGLRGKNVLDIGSGRGEMLAVMAEAGLSAVGIEASPASVATARSAGRKMVEGYIGDADRIDGQPFDGFICLNYLEHQPDPGAIIRKIHDVTGEGAFGFVTVPNLEYLLKTKCFYEFVADHLSYFTSRTLPHAFESNGFDVVEKRLINEDNDIAVFVKKREPLDLFPAFEEDKALIEDLRGVIAGYTSRGKKVAVWGAGHRTLALLALGAIKNLAYVIDSAKFKQGRFTPVLHAEIVPPEHLKEDPPGLVIVMVPGLYPQEVLKTLRQMNCGADIALLEDNKIKLVEKKD